MLERSIRTAVCQSLHQRNSQAAQTTGIKPEYEMIVHLIQGKPTKPEDIIQSHELLRSEMVAAQLHQKEYYNQY